MSDPFAPTLGGFSGPIRGLPLGTGVAEIMDGRRNVVIANRATVERGLVALHDGTAYVGMAFLVDCCPADDAMVEKQPARRRYYLRGRYKPGQWFWMLSNASRLDAPVPAPKPRPLALVDPAVWREAPW